MKISSLQPLPAGPFSIQKVRLSYGSVNHYDEHPCRRAYSFIVEKDTLVLVMEGTLYTGVNDVEYAEAKGALRYLKPGDKVHFIARKASSDIFFEYAEFVLISM